MRLQLRSLVAALAILFTVSPMAQAIDLYWEWSFTANSIGFQKGYFVTDGGPFTGSAPAGTYTISGFSVTQASGNVPIGSISDGKYNVSMPTQGFVWNGTAATQFYRNSGGYTNGSNFGITGTSNALSFSINGSSAQGSVFIYPFNYYSGALTLTPVTNPVPEPSTYALAAIATGVMAALARRRKARKA